MYVAIILILLAGAIFLISLGVKKKQGFKIASGSILAAITILFFFWFMEFWGEMLWFDSVGYRKRFWTVWSVRMALIGAGALFGFLWVYLFTFSLPAEKKWLRFSASVVGAVICGLWGTTNWEIMLKYWFKTTAGIVEPILNKDAGFYLFELPFYEKSYAVLLTLSIVVVITSFFGLFFKKVDEPGNKNFRLHPLDENEKIYRSFYLSVVILILVLAAGKYLQRFDLLFSSWGAVSGPGWTDVKIRLPGYNLMAIITAAAGLLFLVSGFRRWLVRLFSKDPYRHQPFSVLVVLGGIFILWFLVLGVVPGLLQWLRVEPNEITFEKPYIRNNIKFTRHGFRLDEIDDRSYPVTGVFNSETVKKNVSLFNNIRLWDWRALDAVYKQFQEIRLYYEFDDVDVDRYMINDDYRQVMVSARELDLGNLPVQSQTFVNKRFKYTHGFGLTLTKVNEFTPEGLPELLVKDIPPKSKYQSLEVDQPRIYYGELTEDYVIANSEEPEFDYPSGEENIYNRYDGTGGVQISNIWRKFLYGWKYGGTRFFLSTYPKEESRIMFHRKVLDRVTTLAPFLNFDKDPYIVLEKGKLYWIVDAYTASDYFPYSEPFFAILQGRGYQLPGLKNIRGINYIRNSVKAVIDAYNGTVDFYIFEKDDPLIQVYDNIFPGLFKSRDEMPEYLEKHVRYPVDMLSLQGQVFSKYHMTDPVVFYNNEDLWERATEKYYGESQPVEPYYVMWEAPETDQMEFILMQPFTPKKRQVLIGWIAGRCDGENYGKMLAYKFPKEKRVLGPQQVETKIDQDPFLSGQLTLWDQRGSNVIRGNVLAIPVEGTIFYVEPIYLEAETAAYPELRLVVVMHEDNMSYAKSFDEALAGLLGEPLPEEVKEKLPQAPETDKAEIEVLTMREQIDKANEAFENYLQYTSEKQFDKAAEELKRLQETLERLSEEK